MVDEGLVGERESPLDRVVAQLDERHLARGIQHE